MGARKGRKRLRATATSYTAAAAAAVAVAEEKAAAAAAAAKMPVSGHINTKTTTTTTTKKTNTTTTIVQDCSDTARRPLLGPAQTAEVPMAAMKMPMLYATIACPFAHRAMLALALRPCKDIVVNATVPTGNALGQLEHLGLPAGDPLQLYSTEAPMPTVEMLRKRKELYVSEVTSSGETPVLRLPCGTVLVESEIVSEYIDSVSTAPGPRLVPADPVLASKVIPRQDTHTHRPTMPQAHDTQHVIIHIAPAPPPPFFPLHHFGLQAGAFARRGGVSLESKDRRVNTIYALPWQVRVSVKRFAPLPGHLIRLLMNQEPADDTKMVAALDKALHEFTKTLEGPAGAVNTTRVTPPAKRPRTDALPPRFCHGEHPTLADIVAGPMLYRMAVTTRHYRENPYGIAAFGTRMLLD